MSAAGAVLSFLASLGTTGIAAPESGFPVSAGMTQRGGMMKVGPVRRPSCAAILDRQKGRPTAGRIYMHASAPLDTRIAYMVSWNLDPIFRALDGLGASRVCPSPPPTPADRLHNCGEGRFPGPTKSRFSVPVCLWTGRASAFLQRNFDGELHNKLHGAPRTGLPRVRLWTTTTCGPTAGPVRPRVPDGESRPRSSSGLGARRGGISSL